MSTGEQLLREVRRLADRADIRDCVERYARGMDRRDRDLLRSAYHDGAIDDHGAFVGEVDDFIDWAFAYHATQTRYQHFLQNHTTDVDGDTAHAETYYVFMGTDSEPANHMTIAGGRYIDRLERRDGRWAIAARVCIAEWMYETTSMVTEDLIGMLSAVQRPTKDRTDPSYLRPLTLTLGG
jgi:hypothetical protein